jgi:nitrate/TMAO reductase-like tetraheme cytochrome c subunit
LPDRPDESDAAPGEPARTRFSRVGKRAARPVRPPRSSRGFLLALVVVGGVGSVTAIGGTAFQRWSETEGFCSRCHTMTPEVTAHKLGVHRDVACGECHVAPGIVGLVKSKLRGSIQLFQVITGSYPRPISAPDPNLLPPPEDTCMKCHPLSEIAGEGSQVKLVMHSIYREDKANTRETVAVMVRPYRLGEGQASRGAHWHVEQKVEYATPEKNSQKIDWIRVTYKGGRTEQFLARSQVGVSSDVRPDISRLGRTETTRKMNCITCHNRVGHESPSPDEAVNSAMAQGKISQSLPYIKREGVARLSKRYRSTGEADRAIEGIRGMYTARYPLVSKAQGREVNNSVDQLKQIYPLVADPNMNEISANYPSNLGHQSGPGCFRCHDGAHFAVGPNGRLLSKTIPWECTTCHTFPQVGKTVSSVSLLSPPPDHLSKLWVFEHGRSPEALVPSSNSSFCTNCHSSGAAKVNHEEMLYHHPQVIEKAGLQACGYCHREAFCARCHKQPVLGSSRTDLYSEPSSLSSSKLK